MADKRKNDGGRRVQRIRVPKRHVDPFDAKRQAEDMARRHADVELGANDRGLEFEARDAGEYYEVEIRANPGRGSGGLGFGGGVGLGLGESHGRPDHAGERGPPEYARTRRSRGREWGEDDFVPTLSLTGPSQARTADPEGRLMEGKSIAELRRLSKRYGVHLRSTDSKRRIARKLATQAPVGARREIGLR